MSLRRPVDPSRRHHWYRGLRWFAAEFLVVVTGVLVALALGAWWQDRDNRAREAGYLHQLERDLDLTERAMRDISEFHIESALAAARVGQAFWAPDPPTLAQLSADLIRPFRSLRERPVLGTIETLIATGDLRLIRSDALRTELTTFAEFAKATIENIQRHDETYYRPGVNALVENLDTNQLRHEAQGASDVATSTQSRALSSLPDGDRRVPFPTDIEALLSNRALYAAYERLLVAHRNQGINYRHILERARRLLGEIHRELHGGLDPGNCQLAFDGERYVGPCGGLAEDDDDWPMRLHQVDEFSGIDGLGVPEPYWKFTGDSVPEETGGQAVVVVDVRGRGRIQTPAGRFDVTGLSLNVLRSPVGQLSFRIESSSRESHADPAGQDEP